MRTPPRSRHGRLWMTLLLAACSTTAAHRRGESQPGTDSDALVASSLPAPPSAPAARGAIPRRLAAAPAPGMVPAGGGAAQVGTVATPQPTPNDRERQPLLIYTAQLRMAVFQVRESLRAVEQVARELGGFLAQQGGNQITIRVPAARFDEALGRVEKLGDLLDRQVQAQDVTDEFLDTEIRIKNARAVRQRLEQLLARANKIDESIAIERELARVTNEIEQLEGRLKQLRDRISFSTVTVVFDERGREQVAKGSFRLPFPWLDQLGLSRLLDLGAGRDR